jgi:hypothetical protein
MNRYDRGFREPPWVMGSPKEVMDWIESSHPSKKSYPLKKDKENIDKKYLTNLHIKFDLDVNKKEIKPTNFFSRITRSKIVEEDFDLLKTSELILRGLAKAKFRNTARIIVDGKTLYEHPEKKSDLRKTIEDIDDFSNEIKEGKFLEITAILDYIEKAEAKIKIKKIHNIKDHSVDILIKGKIRKNIYHTFLNYLNDKIDLNEES